MENQQQVSGNNNRRNTRRGWGRRNWRRARRRSQEEWTRRYRPREGSKKERQQDATVSRPKRDREGFLSSSLGKKWRRNKKHNRYQTNTLCAIVKTRTSKKIILLIQNGAAKARRRRRRKMVQCTLLHLTESWGPGSHTSWTKIANIPSSSSVHSLDLMNTFGQILCTWVCFTGHCTFVEIMGLVTQCFPPWTLLNTLLVNQTIASSLTSSNLRVIPRYLMCSLNYCYV